MGLKRNRDRVHPSTVGRVGELRLNYARQGRKTIVARSHCTSPWHFFPPISLDDTGAAYTLLLNPSGGLVGGDHLSVNMTLDAETHVLISTPSANRVYRSLSEVSVQLVDISVGPGAILEWAPEPTIPFAGSRFRQVIHVKLAAGATVLFWDAIASGRIARGERWAFANLENEIRITAASGASVMERYDLRPLEDQRVIGLAEEWDYVASLYVVGDKVGANTWARLEASLAVALEDRPGQVLGGVSAPSIGGLAVKLVARAAPDLHAVLETLWASIRSHLWGLPPAVLRRY